MSGDPRQRLFFREKIGAVAATTTVTLFTVPDGMSGLRIIAARLTTQSDLSSSHDDAAYYTAVLHTAVGNKDLSLLSTSELVIDGSGVEVVPNVPVDMLHNTGHLSVRAGETVQVVLTKVSTAADMADVLIEIEAVPY
jgi:hypothetical protein